MFFISCPREPGWRVLEERQEVDSVGPRFCCDKERGHCVLCILDELIVMFFRFDGVCDANNDRTDSTVPGDLVISL